MPGMGGKRSGRSGENAAKASGGNRNGPTGVEATVSGGALIDLEYVRGLIAAVDESGIDSLEIHRRARGSVSRRRQQLGRPWYARSPL